MSPGQSGSESASRLERTVGRAEGFEGVKIEEGMEGGDKFGNGEKYKGRDGSANPPGPVEFAWQSSIKSLNMRYKVTPQVDWGKDLDWRCLKGKNAFVTGGASGMGAAFVEALVEGGASVTVADLDKQKGIALRERLKARGFK